MLSVRGETVGIYGQCNRQEVKQGCSVDQGHALCESWDIAYSIHGLPSCTTRITFSLLADPHLINKTTWVTTKFHDVNFRNLPRLYEFSIEANQTSYPFVQLQIDGAKTFKHLTNVTILRMKVDHYLQPPSEKNMYRYIKALALLDISRSLIGLSAASRIIGQPPVMRTLMLKNVQEKKCPRNEYSPFVDLAEFICGGNIEYLDLSYNYIVSVHISQWCWNSKLRYLNIDQNFLAASSPTGLNVLFKIVPIVSALEVFQGNVWTDATFQDGLWDDSNIVDNTNTDDDMELSPLLKLLQGTPFSFLAGYDYWLTDVMKHCGNIKYLDVVPCTSDQKADLCSFLKCVAPEFNMHDCPKQDVMLQLQYFAKTMCTYKHCAYNIPFPLPPKLRSIRSNNFGNYTNSFVEPQKILYSLCFHHNNNLEVLDLPNLNGYIPQKFTWGFEYLWFTKTKIPKFTRTQIASLYVSCSFA